MSGEIHSGINYPSFHMPDPSYVSHPELHFSALIYLASPLYYYPSSYKKKKGNSSINNTLHILKVPLTFISLFLFIPILIPLIVFPVNFHVSSSLSSLQPGCLPIAPFLCPHSSTPLLPLVQPSFLPQLTCSYFKPN
jgi:hypothetical protein